MLVLRGLPLLWLLPDRAGWAGDVLWVWREVGGTQISDTEDNTKFPKPEAYIQSPGPGTSGQTQDMIIKWTSPIIS